MNANGPPRIETTIVVTPEGSSMTTLTRGKLQALIASAEECERLLKFAFEEGALPDETVLGLCIDPYGLLRDLRLSIAAVKHARKLTPQ